MIRLEDLKVLQELSKVSNMAFKHEIVHYLYFQKKSDANVVVKDLRRTGFEIENDPAADRSTWLVLAKHQIVPTEEGIEEVVTRMEELAEKHRGKYDGWEAGVISKSINATN